MICSNLSVRGSSLYFADVSVARLAEEFGTPLYLMDQARIREMCRAYRRAMQNAFGDRFEVLYASKACAFKQLYRVMREENMGIDVVSSGEICAAAAAGFDLSRAYFHSNNKTDADLAYALEMGVGAFVIDNIEEAVALDGIAEEKGKRAKVLLRITPGIDPHTYDEVATGKVDSKFGSAIETGQAMQITGQVLSLRSLDLAGFHCHVGSQVFDADVFLRSAEKMIGFIAEVRDALGFLPEELDLGGGLGVRYLKEDPVYDLSEIIALIGDCLVGLCAAHDLPMPRILMEPGRSIVADAGMTVYTVGTVKRIPGYKNYVSVDGGMTDNPRFALYGARYSVEMPEKMNEEKSFCCSVVGRCCESGDILAENVLLPEGIRRGDLIAFLTTGAYHFSMQSHYNRIPNLPVVMLEDQKATLAVRRETVEDLLRLEL